MSASPKRTSTQATLADPPATRFRSSEEELTKGLFLLFLKPFLEDSAGNCLIASRTHPVAWESFAQPYRAWLKRYAPTTEDDMGTLSHLLTFFVMHAELGYCYAAALQTLFSCYIAKNANSITPDFVSLFGSIVLILRFKVGIVNQNVIEVLTLLAKHAITGALMCLPSTWAPIYKTLTNQDYFLTNSGSLWQTPRAREVFALLEPIDMRARPATFTTLELYDLLRLTADVPEHAAYDYARALVDYFSSKPDTIKVSTGMLNILPHATVPHHFRFVCTAKRGGVLDRPVFRREIDRLLGEHGFMPTTKEPTNVIPFAISVGNWKPDPYTDSRYTHQWAEGTKAPVWRVAEGALANENARNAYARGIMHAFFPQGVTGSATEADVKEHLKRYAVDLPHAMEPDELKKMAEAVLDQVALEEAMTAAANKATTTGVTYKPVFESIEAFLAVQSDPAAHRAAAAVQRKNEEAQDELQRWTIEALARMNVPAIDAWRRPPATAPVAPAAAATEAPAPAAEAPVTEAPVPAAEAPAAEAPAAEAEAESAPAQAPAEAEAPAAEAEAKSA